MQDKASLTIAWHHVTSASLYDSSLGFKNLGVPQKQRSYPGKQDHRGLSHPWFLTAHLYGSAFS